MDDNTQTQPKRTQLGQSLTEVALVLPIILLIIAGLVEISNLIVTQSRLDAAVRRSVRFGAQGGVDEGMRIALLQAITPTLSLDPELWDVYVLRAKVNTDGNDYVAGTWSFAPLFGNQAVRPLADIDQGEIQAEILSNLRQNSGDASLAANYELVGMMAFYNTESILALDNFLRGFNHVRGFAVMRITPVATAQVTSGCEVFPIAIEEGVRSINGPDEFPEPGDFEYPDDNLPELGDFYHPDRVPAPRSMLDAQPGQLFVVTFNRASNGQPQPRPSMFDFTRWDWYGVLRQREALALSLTWPGNSAASCADGPGGDVGWEHPILGCELDSDLHVGDPVRVNVAMPDDMGNNNEIKEALEEHVDRGRVLRVMLFNIDDAPPPADELRFDSDEQRKVSNFVLVRPLGFNLVANGTQEWQDKFRDWMLFEFVRLDTSCGVDSGG